MMPATTRPDWWPVHGPVLPLLAVAAIALWLPAHCFPACGASRVVVRESVAVTLLENGRIALEVTQTGGAVALRFKAASPKGEWRGVCASFRPDCNTHPEGNRFFDTAFTPLRFQVSELLRGFAVTQRTPGEARLRLTGRKGRTKIEETISLKSRGGSRARPSA